MGQCLSVPGRHRRHANPFSLRHRVDLSGWPPAGAGPPWAIDVGTGPGAFTCGLARGLPWASVLGIEIRAHLAAALADLAQQQGIGNLHPLVADASCHLPGLMPRGSVCLVTLNFPDPWYKRRHQKRRVLSASWLEQLAPLLHPQAELYAATDYWPLAESMALALAAAGHLEPLPAGAGWARPLIERTRSERELHHLGRNMPIHRLAYRRRGAPGAGAGGPGAPGPLPACPAAANIQAHCPPKRPQIGAMPRPDC